MTEQKKANVVLLILEKAVFKTSIGRDKWFIKIKRSVYQEDITILNGYV